MEQLSPREFIVARLISLGKTDREIAHALRLSVRTIESVMGTVCLKLGLSSREDVAALPLESRES